jgi:hypothetical protein
MKDIPHDPAAIAEQLFGASEVRSAPPALLRGAGAPRARGERRAEASTKREISAGEGGPKALPDRGEEKRSRNQFGVLIGIAGALAFAGALAAVLGGAKGSTTVATPADARSAEAAPTASLSAPPAAAVDATTAPAAKDPAPESVSTAAPSGARRKTPPGAPRKKGSVFVVP